MKQFWKTLLFGVILSWNSVGFSTESRTTVNWYYAGATLAVASCAVFAIACEMNFKGHRDQIFLPTYFAAFGSAALLTILGLAWQISQQPKPSDRFQSSGITDTGGTS